MALTPLEALNKVVEDRLARTTLRSARTLRLLYEAGRTKTKTNTTIDWNVEAGLGAAAVEPVTQDGADTATDDTVPAQLRIGRYRVKHQFPISRISIAEAATRAPGELSGLFGEHIDRGLNHIFRRVNNLLHTGLGTAADAEILGLASVANNSLSYAGISPTTYPNWRALRLDNGGTPRALTKDLMLDLEELLEMNEASYNAILCSPNTSKKYNQVFDDVAGGIASDASMATRDVDLGHGARTYNGVPIITDPQMPNGVMYFLNLSDIDLFSFQLGTARDPKSMVETKVNPVNAYGMNLHVAELPSNNSAAQRFELFVLPQLRVFNRKSIAVIGDIA